MNFIPAQVTQVGGGGWAVKFAEGAGHCARATAGWRKPCVLGLRPQYVTRANGDRPGHQRVGVTVELVQPTGSRAYITFPLGGRAGLWRNWTRMRCRNRVNILTWICT